MSSLFNYSRRLFGGNGLAETKQRFAVTAFTATKDDCGKYTEQQCD